VQAPTIAGEWNYCRYRAQPKTAFVFAGGGSFGAIQVGMLHALAAHGIVADAVFGSSVGALNGAYYAGLPTIEGIRQLEAIWRESTNAWLAGGGLERPKVHEQLGLHKHSHQPVKSTPAN
jgi:predicted acylesterase/phospholipase RssA